MGDVIVIGREERSLESILWDVNQFHITHSDPEREITLDEKNEL